MSTPSSAIAVRGLRKSFKDKLVLDGIDLDIKEGTVFSLLGPNGAGKTTTVRILSTLSKPDAGQAWIAGKELAREPDAVRAAIGVTGQFAAVDGLLTGSENLVLMGKLHHLGKRESRQRATELLEKFDLAEAAGKSLATYSGGMRRRLDLAMTLVGKPRIIFLDEPTAGLDPRSRRTMWQIIHDLVSQDGVTILLTTQYLEEADQLADRIAVLDQGRLVAEGTPAELKQLVPGGHVSLRFSGLAELDLAAQRTRRDQPRRRGPDPPGAQRRRGPVAALAAGPAQPGEHRTGRAHRAHPRPGRRLPRPDRPLGRLPAGLNPAAASITETGADR